MPHVLRQLPILLALLAPVAPTAVAQIRGEAQTIPLTLVADGGAANDAVVTLGVPLPPGTLLDASLVRVRDASGAEVPAHSASLARWPGDGTQRSVLVAFRASLAQGASAQWRIEIGQPRTREAGPLAANPDGPVSALLPPRWHAQSLALGFQQAGVDNADFARWETLSDGALSRMSPAWGTYGLNCASTSNHRTYYDATHAFYQRFAYRPSAASYRRAREELRWSRSNDLKWFANSTVAVFACENSWNAATPLQWASLRRMPSQGMLDDYLLTGDPASLAAVRGLGEAFRQNLPALMARGDLRATERNMAWVLMGLAAYRAVAPDDATVGAALRTVVDDAIAWQAASGAFERDLNRSDPSECAVGPRGASPFMTSLLVDGLMDAYLVSGDARIGPVVVNSARWLRDSARTSNGRAFRYLWGCQSDPYDDDSTQDLNVLIAHVFGAAFFFSNDTRWLDTGDTMMNHGLDAYFGGRPKQWTQSARTATKYFGYRRLRAAAIPATPRGKRPVNVQGSAPTDGVEAPHNAKAPHHAGLR